MQQSLDIVGSKIRARTSYKYVDALHRITGGHWNREVKAFEWTASGLLAEQLDGMMSVDVQRTAAFIAYIDAHKLVPLSEAQVCEPIPVTKLDPWPHQLQAYHQAYNFKGALLDAFMGTGKTKITIDLIQNRGHKRVLVLCPPKVIPVWESQFAQHCAIPYRMVLLDTSGNKKADARAAFASTADDKLLVTVISYHSAFREPFKAWSLAQKWDLVVCDESHILKAPGGVISKYVAALGRHSQYRLALTGTPLAHSPLDAYGQFRFIDPSVFGTSFTVFRTRYAIMNEYIPTEIIGWQNEADFYRRYYSRTIKIPREVLNLRPPIHVYPPDVPWAELGGDAARLYDEIASDFITELSDGTIVNASNALVQLLRLHQLAGGFLAGQQLDNSKLEVLEELLDEIGDEPTVIFALFRDEITAIHKVVAKLGRKSLEISGTGNDLPRWPQAGNVLVVQVRAGGAGIDLTAAHYCIYYSKGFSLGEYDQSLARIHRPGQTETVTYYHLLTKHTVDSRIERALKERRDVIADILRDRSLD